LHVTGGGREIQYSEGHVVQAHPTLRVTPNEIEPVVSVIGTPPPIARRTIGRALATYESLAVNGVSA
jgi:hypothetical protein